MLNACFSIAKYIKGEMPLLWYCTWISEICKHLVLLIAAVWPFLHRPNVIIQPLP